MSARPAKLRLFPMAPPVSPPRTRRVLGSICDAGDRYRQYHCQQCALEWSIHLSGGEEERSADHYDRFGTDNTARRMCPRCNPAEVFKAWGMEPDEYDDPLTPEQKAAQNKETDAWLDNVFGPTEVANETKTEKESGRV